MNNLNIETVSQAEQVKEKKRKKEELKDLLDIREAVKFAIDNSHYQNKEIKSGTFFISYEGLEDLPDTIVKIVDKAIENGQ